jgi:hypothetical protein
MSDRFPPDWFVRQNPWVPWMPDAAPNPTLTFAAAAPTSSMLPTSTSDQDGSLSFHHGGFNWVETPNGGLLAVHPNGEGVDWVETPSGGLLAFPKRQVQPAWAPAAIPEHLDSARYWGAAPPPASAGRMPGDSYHLSPVPQVSSWDATPTSADATATAQWTVPAMAPALGLSSPGAVPSAAAQTSSSPPQGSGFGNSPDDPRHLGRAEQIQQGPDTLSPQEIERICRMDPGQEAARVLNEWLPRAGQVDPTTGQVRTLDWVKQQAYDMQKMIERLQQELRCDPI